MDPHATAFQSGSPLGDLQQSQPLSHLKSLENMAHIIDPGRIENLDLRMSTEPSRSLHDITVPTQKENRWSGSTLIDSAEWAPQSRELLIMISLAIITLAVALDATIVVTSLPVRTKQIYGVRKTRS